MKAESGGERQTKRRGRRKIWIESHISEGNVLSEHIQKNLYQNIYYGVKARYYTFYLLENKISPIERR